MLTFRTRISAGGWLWGVNEGADAVVHVFTEEQGAEVPAEVFTFRPGSGVNERVVADFFSCRVRTSLMMAMTMTRGG